MPAARVRGRRRGFARARGRRRGRLFVECALDPDFPDFLTLPAYAEVLRVERA